MAGSIQQTLLRKEFFLSLSLSRASLLLTIQTQQKIPSKRSSQCRAIVSTRLSSVTRARASGRSVWTTSDRRLSETIHLVRLRCTATATTTANDTGPANGIRWISSTRLSATATDRIRWHAAANGLLWQSVRRTARAVL